MLDAAYGTERDKLIQSRAAVLPGKRVGTAEEVAQVILLLMTNLYITGEGDPDRRGQPLSLIATSRLRPSVPCARIASIAGTGKGIE